MARVSSLSQTDLPEEYRYLLSEDAMGEINLLCAIANNPNVLQSYMRYGSTLWSKSGLDPSDLELCILTVARALEARYEWHQHVHIARDRGVTRDELGAVAATDFGRFSDRRAALLRYVQAVALGDVTDELFDRLADHHDEATVVGATLLATHYLATARFLDALAVPLEDDFVGWDLSGLDG